MTMPMSPGAQQDQAIMAGGGGGGAQAIFEKTFSDMAYETLQQKSADLVPSVVTFRVMSADLEKGHAVGAFLVAKDGHIAYVPTVLADNKIQPVEILYSKTLGKFLPLSDKWLSEVFKVQASDIGEAATLPTNVNTEVGLKHLFTPSSSGRYGYASYDWMIDEVDEFNRQPKTAFFKELLVDKENKTASFFESKIRGMLKKTTLDNSIRFMRNLVGSSNKIAEWYLNKFDGPKGLAQYFCVGKKPVANTKIANVLPRVKVLKKSDKMAEFKRYFGEKAPEKYQEALKKGYVVKTAQNLSMAGHLSTKSVVRLSESLKNELKRNYDAPVSQQLKLKTEEPLQTTLKLEWPMGNGFYRVYLTNGKTHDVFVVSDRDNFAPIRGLQTEGARHIIIYANGSYASVYDCAGTPIARHVAESTNIFKYLTKSLSKNGVKKGYGLFIRLGSPDKFDICGPYRLDRVSSGNSEVRCTTVDGYEIILQKDRDRGGKIHLKDSKLIRLSNEYRFVPLTSERKDTYFKQTSDIYRALEEGVIRVAESRFDIKFDSSGDLFYVNNRPKTRGEAVEDLLMLYGLDEQTSEDLLDETKQSNFKVAYATLNAYGRYKIGKFFKGANFPASYGGMPPGMAPDPSMAGPQVAGQPPMGAEMPQEDISPEELEALAADSAALQQILSMDPQLAQIIAQKLQEAASQDPQIAELINSSPTLQELLGVGGGQPPMDPAMMQGGGQPPMDPAMMQGMDPAMMQGGGQPPMDPAMMQGMDPAMMQGGGQPPMDPAMMQGMDPAMMQGMDPAMMQGMDPAMMQGMDPAMMQQQGPPPPTGMTNSTTPGPEAINPQFQGDPNLLQDPEIMQMAHLDVLLRSPTLRDVIAEYEDTLIKALDHLGRILFTLYVKSPELKEEIGNLQFRAIETGVRNLFRSMGDTILDLHQNTAILSRTLSTGMQSQDNYQVT